MNGESFRISGIPSSPGEGVGFAIILEERHIPQIAMTTSASFEEEYARFETGLGIAQDYYYKTMKRTEERLGMEEAEIFEGYLELLTGGDLEEAVEEILKKERGVSAVAAVLRFCSKTADEFAEMDSEYFRQRAADFRDIGDRLAEAIHYGEILDVLALAKPSIIVARTLSPATTVTLDFVRVSGIATETGGPASHAAILARSLSIPCITGVENLLERIHSGDTCLVNGDKGYIEVGISQEVVDKVTEKNRVLKHEMKQMCEWSQATEAELSNGEKILLKANVGSSDEAGRAFESGAQGSGLVRTEFIFMSFDRFPSVEQQVSHYREICRKLAPHTVTIRLLDYGADKPLPYAKQVTEENPFLGERGIRFLLGKKDVLHTQLRALGELHSEGHKVRAMIPMLISLREIQRVREMLQEINPALPLGIMVETPASVIGIHELAQASDFLSIGTNDLVQYLLAVDRRNPKVAELYEELHPTVIRALVEVVNGAKQAGVPLGVCGGMASHPITALALLSLGIRELSASTSWVPRLKMLIRSISPNNLEELAPRVTGSKTHQECRNILIGKINEIMGEGWL